MPTYPIPTQAAAAMVTLVKTVTGVLDAGHDLPMDFDKHDLPYAWVYDGQELFGTEEATSHYFNTLDLHVVLGFPATDEDGDRPRQKGQVFKAGILTALAADFQLGGVVSDCLPVMAVVQDAIDGVNGAAALVMQFVCRYHHQHADPYTLA